MSFDQNTLDSLKIDRAAPGRPSSGARGWTVALVLMAAVAVGASYWFLLRAQPLEVELATALAGPLTSTGARAAAAVLNATG